MAQLDTYLFFDGNCRDALRFYEKTLGGKIDFMMTHGESPMAAQATPGNKDRIMHASMTIGGRMLMASDAMAGDKYEGLKGFSMSLSFDTVEEGQRIFKALGAGGKVTMPMEKTFWAKSFGMLVDRFGVAWMINVPDQQFMAA
jgi:PhnB protein